MTLKYARGIVILAAETKEQLNATFKLICDLKEVSNFHMEYVEFDLDENENAVNLKFVHEPSLYKLAKHNLERDNDS